MFPCVLQPPVRYLLVQWVLLEDLFLLLSWPVRIFCMNYDILCLYSCVHSFYTVYGLTGNVGLFLNSVSCLKFLMMDRHGYIDISIKGVFCILHV